MSIALIVTRGFGNGTLTGSIKDVVTRGYTIGGTLFGPTLGASSLISLAVGENSSLSISYGSSSNINTTVGKG